MRTRKNLPKTALPRIYYIDREIASGNYPNANTLAAGYETSVSSINRDIDFMRWSLDAPIEYDALHRGFYYSEKTYRLPAGFTTAEDMLALGMAKNLLSLYRDTPVYTAAKNLLDGITAPLAEGKAAAWYESRIVVPPVASSLIGPDVWELITEGLRNNRVIAFEYRGVYDSKYNPRRVRPYQLLFDNGSWNLYGYAEERRDTRIFKLSRITNAVLTGDSFVLPPDFDYCTKASGSHFGIFEGHDEYQFKIAFYNEAVPWVKERQWAADQNIEEINFGVVISFSSTQYNKVLEWALSQGGNARPMEPPELVEDWGWHLDLMKRQLNGTAQNREVIFFDLETNGLSGNSSVLSVTAIKAFFNGTDIEESRRFTRYYFRNPGEKENADAIDVNGLTDEVIRDRRGDAPYPEHFKDDADFIFFLQRGQSFCGTQHRL
jgi:predicted DNA-binding transcriptional regulator YafY